MAKKNKTKKQAKTKKSPQRAPTTADAEVVVKLYDLRREPVMRAARDTLLRWQPKSAAEVAELADFEHEHNAAFRQVTSYFEMAFGLARSGAVHKEMICDWCGEGIYLYSKIHPFLDEFRKSVSPTAFSNAEWITQNSESGKARLALLLARAAAN